MLPNCCQTIKNGLPPMTPERFKAAKKKFTPKAIEAIRQELNPPVDFDLEGRLWHALHLYHYVSEPDFLSFMSPTQQHAAFAKVTEKTADLLGLLRNQPGVMHCICDDSLLLAELSTCLEHLQKHCEAYRPKLPPIEGKRPIEKGQRVFFNELAKIYKDATSRSAPGRFYKLCHDILIGVIEEENVKRIARPTRKYYKTA